MTDTRTAAAAGRDSGTLWAFRGPGRHVNPGIVLDLESGRHANDYLRTRYEAEYEAFREAFEAAARSVLHV